MFHVKHCLAGSLNFPRERNQHNVFKCKNPSQLQSSLLLRSPWSHLETKSETMPINCTSFRHSQTIINSNKRHKSVADGAALPKGFPAPGHLVVL